MSSTLNVAACDICKSRATKARFRSCRIVICQRCVTFLCATQIHTPTLLQSIQRVAERICSDLDFTNPYQCDSSSAAQQLASMMMKGETTVPQSKLLREFEFECLKKRWKPSPWIPSKLRTGDIAKYLCAMTKKLVNGTELSRRSEDWNALRLQIVQQDKFLCQICERKAASKHVHHIVPLSRFGTNHPNNLITLCIRCHSRQHPDIKLTKGLN